ncbi:MAG: hypothetical protein KatS3mg031_3147 [Chitinophagales bacterium]|nr:MAG: hypothetical protein KatS3mg031_3147 [Chitinophagales bacterium]
MNSDFQKVIEALDIKFLRARYVQIQRPFVIKNFCDVDNALFLLHKGDISLRIGEELIEAQEGDILFIPAGKQAYIAYGKGEGAEELTYEDYLARRDEFFLSVQDGALYPRLEDSFSYITFSARIFDAVSFFANLDIPPFIISGEARLRQLIEGILQEEFGREIGKERMLKNKTEELVIGILRYIVANNLFMEKLATNMNYFKDPRLIDILNYIKNYLSGDLSNKVLASVANISEDYVGQYFKAMMGINPQDYIEYQRMEKAVELLRTTKKSIREIGREVGYKDTAYFCRRFKMMFGISAGKMRKRTSLMNV